MPRYLNILFRTSPPPEESRPGDHPGTEELAALAQGLLEEGRRKEVIEHVLSCSRCYGIVDATLTELELDRPSRSSGTGGLWKRPGLALAASVLIALVGIGIYRNLPDYQKGLAPAPTPQAPATQAPAPEPAPLAEATPAPVPQAEPQPEQARSEPEVPASRKAKAPIKEEQLMADAAEAEPRDAEKAPAGVAAVSPAPAPSEAAKPAVVAQAPPAKPTRGLNDQTGGSAGEGSTQALTKARPAQSPPPSPPGRSVLYLPMDENILALLQENDNEIWSDSDRIGRFRELIRSLGSARELPGRIAWAGPYPAETLDSGTVRGLILTIENDRATLELKTD